MLSTSLFEGILKFVLLIYYQMFKVERRTFQGYSRLTSAGTFTVTCSFARDSHRHVGTVCGISGTVSSRTRSGHVYHHGFSTGLPCSFFEA